MASCETSPMTPAVTAPENRTAMVVVAVGVGTDGGSVVSIVLAVPNGFRFGKEASGMVVDREEIRLLQDAFGVLPGMKVIVINSGGVRRRHIGEIIMQDGF